MGGFSMDLIWINNVIIYNQGQRRQYDENCQPIRHFGMSGNKTFQKTCDYKEGYRTHHYFKPVLNPSFKGFQASISTGKKNSIGQDQSGTACNYNYGYFDGSMDPYGACRFPQKSFLIKKVLKTPQHNTVL